MASKLPAPLVVVSDEVTLVPLMDGWRFASIDTADAGLVSPFRWSWQGAYAQSGRWKDGRRVLMHRLLSPDEWPEVDHRNGNGLDNRRDNLRRATSSQNKGNLRRLRTKKTSQFKGVSWAGDRWRASLTFQSHSRNLGYFTTEKAAARTYDRAALRAWGEFAATNERLGLLGPLGSDEVVEDYVARYRSPGRTSNLKEGKARVAAARRWVDRYEMAVKGVVPYTAPERTTVTPQWKGARK